MNTIETAILSGFWQKNDLGPLGDKVNMLINKQICYLSTLEKLFVKLHIFQSLKSLRSLQVESSHSYKKWIFSDFSKFVRAKLIKHG